MDLRRIWGLGLIAVSLGSFVFDFAGRMDRMPLVDALLRSLNLIVIVPVVFGVILLVRKGSSAPQKTPEDDLEERFQQWRDAKLRTAEADGPQTTYQTQIATQQLPVGLGTALNTDLRLGDSSRFWLVLLLWLGAMAATVAAVSAGFSSGRSASASAMKMASLAAFLHVATVFIGARSLGEILRRSRLDSRIRVIFGVMTLVYCLLGTAMLVMMAAVTIEKGRLILGALTILPISIVPLIWAWKAVLVIAGNVKGFAAFARFEQERSERASRRSGGQSRRGLLLLLWILGIAILVAAFR